MTIQHGKKGSAQVVQMKAMIEFSLTGAVFRTIPEDPNSAVVLTYPASTDHPSVVNTVWPSTSDSRGRRVAVFSANNYPPLYHYYGLERETDISAFNIHEWCYSAFIWKHGACSEARLLHIVENLCTSPLYLDAEEARYETYPQNCLEKLLANAANCMSTLQPLLQRLPLELQYRIWGFVGPTAAYSAFLMVTSEVVRLSREICDESIKSDDLCSGTDGDATMVSAFGIDYIRAISMSRINARVGLPLDEEDMAIEFVAGPMGICAFRIVREHSCGSGWIGKLPAEHEGKQIFWYGTSKFDKSIVFTYSVSQLSLCQFSLTEYIGFAAFSN